MDIQYDQIRALIAERLAASAAERLANQARQVRTTGHTDGAGADGANTDETSAYNDSPRRLVPEAGKQLQNPSTAAPRPAATPRIAGAVSACC